MKKMIISVVLLCSPMGNAVLPSTTRLVYELNNEQAGANEQEAEDAFDAFIDDEDVPSDMIVPAKPVSPCEAYLKEIGVQILMKYIAAKIWLEHQLQSWTKAA